MRSPHDTAVMYISTENSSFQVQTSEYESTHGNHNLVTKRELVQYFNTFLFLFFIHRLWSKYMHKNISSYHVHCPMYHIIKKKKVLYVSSIIEVGLNHQKCIYLEEFSCPYVKRCAPRSSMVPSVSGTTNLTPPLGCSSENSTQTRNGFISIIIIILIKHNKET